MLSFVQTFFKMSYVCISASLDFMRCHTNQLLPVMGEWIKRILPTKMLLIIKSF